MMYDREQLAAKALRASEEFQRRAGRVADLATWVVAGSSLPNYVQLDWRSRDPSTFQNVRWLDLEGSHRHKPFRRQWHFVNVMTLQGEEWSAIKNEHPDARPAVALRKGGLWQIGTNQDDNLHFGQYSAAAGTLAVAGRAGYDPVKMSPAALLTDSGVILGFESAHYRETLVDGHQFAKQHATVRVV